MLRTQFFITNFSIKENSNIVLLNNTSSAITCIYAVGMISGTVVQKFGTLYAGVFGSCLASTGLVMSYFAPSIAMLDITIGLVLGNYFHCFHIILRYFPKKC